MGKDRQTLEQLLEYYLIKEREEKRPLVANQGQIIGDKEELMPGSTFNFRQGERTFPMIQLLLRVRQC